MTCAKNAVGSFFCESCGEYPTHKPFGKQALEVMSKSALSSETDRAEIIRSLFKIRNSLMHGSSGPMIEKEMNVEVQPYADRLGHILKGAIFQVINRSALTGVAGKTITAVNASTFARENMRLDLTMLTREKADLNRLSRFVVPDVSMIVSDREEDAGK